MLPSVMAEVWRWDCMKQAGRCCAAGVVSGKDITSEASVTKLMHLLGRFESKEDVVKSLKISLAGEIS